MTRSLTVALVQKIATVDFNENLDRCLSYAASAARDGAQLIALPEYFCGLRTEGARIHPVAHPEPDNPAIAAFVALARQYGACVLLGSLGIVEGKIFNRSYLIDGDGRIAGRYDKLHLFDIDLPDGTPVRESEDDRARPGSGGRARCRHEDRLVDML